MLLLMLLLLLVWAKLKACIRQNGVLLRNVSLLFVTAQAEIARLEATASSGAAHERKTGKVSILLPSNMHTCSVAVIPGSADLTATMRKDIADRFAC
jgi:putative effector of murein hydrolase LrgA (UPF0299 family)